MNFSILLSGCKGSKFHGCGYPQDDKVGDDL